MAVKARWTFNPRKWFGTSSNVTKKNDQGTNSLIQGSPTKATTRKTTQTQSFATAKTKPIVRSLSNSNDVNTTTVTSVTQLRLPAFGLRREKTSALIPLSSTTTLSRQNTFVASHTEPSIRKNGRFENQLSIETSRWNHRSLPKRSSEVTKRKHCQQNHDIKQSQISVSKISRDCVISYPRYSTNLIEQCLSPARSSLSSINDDNDNSSSSGIFTDERQRTESKGALSTVEALSVESIQDSPTSVSHPQTRPIIHHYRRPMSVFEAIDDKTEQRPSSLILSHRSHSAEDIFQDKQVMSAKRSRQSSAAIIKKIEKRRPTSRSSSATLEQAGVIRISNDTYRLASDKNNHVSNTRKNSTDSDVSHTNYDDPLRSANNEECYAVLPRTSSTDQLNSLMQNDLRIIVNECIRPMMTSMGKSRFTKNQHHRFKRSQNNNDHTQLNIEEITDKLLSSIDCSTYTQYQRCQ